MRLPDSIRKLLPCSPADQLLDANMQLSSELNSLLSDAVEEVTRVHGFDRRTHVEPVPVEHRKINGKAK